MYENSFFLYLATKGMSAGIVFSLMLGPLLLTIPIAVLHRLKRINDKQFINWTSCVLALTITWMVWMVGFYWWIILIVLPASFYFAKLEVLVLIKLSRTSAEKRKQIFGK